MRALRRWFATVDPAKFNGASQVDFAWAYTMVREPDGRRSTSTRQYVVAYFYADGDEMIGAGGMGPGYGDQLLRLSRPSTCEPWRVDGFYYP